MIKRQFCHRNILAVPIAVVAFMTAIFFCYWMIHSINQRMNESATSNLLNTTRVMESTLEKFVDKDYDSLQMIGELYRKGRYLDAGQIDVMCDTMGFEQIRVADAQGQGVDVFAGQFQTTDLPCYEEWTPETTGYADAYFGESGRLQTTLWLPVYRDNVWIGTVFGDVVISKYYSASVFTFYQGEGRAYLVDGSDGKWILRSLGTDGASRRQDDIYSLLLASGNDAKEVQSFRHAIEEKKTGTAVFNFNEKQAYICFIPLSSSTDWYLTTVIPSEILLKESAQVQQMIQLTLVIFCIGLLCSAATFAVWQIRKTRQRESEYREALFANVSSNIDSAFLIYDTSIRQTAFVSENVERLLGVKRDWLQKDAERLFEWCKIPQNDSQKTDFLAGTLAVPAVCEVCVENEIGNESRYIRLELIPADLGQEIAVLTDVTKDKDIQQSLLDAMQRAEAASQAKNDFLSAMSHDIRTPMNGIVGMTAIAAAHLDDRDRMQDCLGKIREASDHLLTIINEVLDMSQIESGKIELTHEPFNLAELLQKVLNLNFPGIQQKNHTVQVHIQPMEHEEVIGDPARLQRVVTNLISNAIKYTPDGGSIRLALKENPPILKGYGCYELVVQDNGIGMSQEFQKKLFVPFEREEDVRISRTQGTGLGMSIVKNIVSLMMGEVQVESEKHKGTTLRVTVNLQLDNQAAQSGTLDNLPVLVVDDDRTTCEAVTGMLDDIGMVGEWVDNGAAAVAKVAARHQSKADFMAVILDWKMPEMDGIETARQIRETVDANVPILILTAYEWSEIETQARDAGVNAFMSKPLYKAKLRKELEKIASGSETMLRLPEMAENRHIPAGKRVLLVEDNELNLEIAAELLGMLGLKTERAEDGEAAVERFAQSQPGTYDLILMDIQMPKMNGYEATMTIRSMGRPDSRTVPIIAMTADTFVKDVQSAYVAGMNEHLAKPISMDRLVHLLAQFLRDGADETQKKGDLLEHETTT